MPFFYRGSQKLKAENKLPNTFSVKMKYIMQTQLNFISCMINTGSKLGYDQHNPHINKFKRKKTMIPITDAQKKIGKIQSPFYDKTSQQSGCQQLTLVILSIWEDEIRRIVIEATHVKKFPRPNCKQQMCAGYIAVITETWVVQIGKMVFPRLPA